nr:MAG TPA: hypothetical protein [Caudoviricetes sp.]
MSHQAPSPPNIPSLFLPFPVKRATSEAVKFPSIII